MRRCPRFTQFLVVLLLGIATQFPRADQTIIRHALQPALSSGGGMGGGPPTALSPQPRIPSGPVNPRNP